MGREAHRPFAIYAWSTLAFTVLVILWGAVVRITGSGAGCGSHWPTCNGQVVPIDPSSHTLIEFTHRLTSGLSLVAVALLVLWSRRLFRSGMAVRRFAHVAFGLILVEALIGAGLVIFELVGGNDSLARAVIIGLHLANTIFLVGALSVCAYLASCHSDAMRLFRWQEQRRFWVVLAGLVATGASGAIVALGDTLFPSESLLAGLKQDFSPGSHFLLQLRIYHPFIAIAATALLLFVIYHRQPANFRLDRTRVGLAVFCATQLLLGTLNVALLAPTWLQMLHLAMANAIVILFFTHWSETVAMAGTAFTKESDEKVDTFVTLSETSTGVDGLSL